MEKNHFYEMGDIGMSLERNKMPTPRHKATHNPIPTSLFCFKMFVCLFVRQSKQHNIEMYAHTQFSGRFSLTTPCKMYNSNFSKKTTRLNLKNKFANVLVLPHGGVGLADLVQGVHVVYCCCQ